MDYYAQLIPDIIESREEKYFAKNHKIGYSKFDFPILSIREAVYEGVGYNRLNHNKTIFIYSQYLQNPQDLCKKLDYKPRLNPEYVPVDYNYMIVQYLPIAKHRGKITIAVNIDLKVSLVPLFVLEMVSKKFCSDFLDEVMTVSNRFSGSKWQ